MTVRPALPADAAALADVAAATFPLACPPSTAAEAIADFIASNLSAPEFAAHLADSARVLLVDDPGDGQPLTGYTMLVVAEPSDPDVVAALRVRPTSELSKIYVRPGHHGSGVAAGLLTATLEAARQRGAAGTWLGTNEQNVRGQRFYAKHGFAAVGTKRFRLGDRLEHDLVFERRL